MSLTANGAVQCNWCGKLSGHPRGEYTKPGGVCAGYIHAPDWDKESEMDICEECASGRCPQCGSDRVVKTHPAVPGPYGWGGRCKDCGGRWGHAAVEHCGGA